MIFCEFLEDVGPDEVDEVVDLLAAIGVLIAEGVEDDAAVDVDVLAEGVVLEGQLFFQFLGISFTPGAVQ